jgi:hypothetical protein
MSDAICNLCPSMTCSVSLPKDIPQKVPDELLQKYCNLHGVCLNKSRGAIPRWKR